MKPHRLATCALSIASLWMAGPAAVAATATATAAPRTITVGHLVLPLCNIEYRGYCGAIERPLDPSGAVPGKVTVGFE